MSSRLIILVRRRSLSKPMFRTKRMNVRHTGICPKNWRDLNIKESSHSTCVETEYPTLKLYSMISHGPCIDHEQFKQLDGYL